MQLKGSQHELYPRYCTCDVLIGKHLFLYRPLLSLGV